jgi:nitrite reductase/ring-hydroxylating ferredoxin subunit
MDNLERELLLGGEDEIEEGILRRVTAEDIDFCVTRLDGVIRVVEDRCPHMSVPLSFGTLEGCIVTCPQHRAQFDLRSYTLTAEPVMGGGNREAAAPATPLDPELAARAERRRVMMASVRTKPLVVYAVVQRDGNVYAVLPNEA